MRIIQFLDVEGTRRVGIVRDAETIDVLTGEQTTRDLALEAIRSERSLAQVVSERTSDRHVDYATLVEDRRIVAPVDHMDPAHTFVTGTGLTHLGSADARDRMHKPAVGTGAVLAGETALTDSMRMFQMGLEGGKPRAGETGVQPEWFYKGDGSIITPPYRPLLKPAFALDAGEEPEIAGLYVIGPDGTPYRLGFALGNEFSDHVMEKQNYLYLAHSKLRPCAFGPELRIGELPQDVRGTSRILRGGEVLWERPFLSGEKNMSHTIANLEAHHFKYRQFRRSGDVHVHFFGTATLSFADGIALLPGDEMEISAEGFGRPLRNPLAVSNIESGDTARRGPVVAL
ncbi:MAG: FAH family protein [Anaerolineae bacterium]|nr:FAH family protein [Anaerolineae bacterium]